MKTTDRLDRIEATLDATNELARQTAVNLDKLSQVTAAIAESVAAHDGQIERLVKVAEIQQARWEELNARFEQLHRDWQAYLTTIHPRQ